MNSLCFEHGHPVHQSPSQHQKPGSKSHQVHKQVRQLVRPHLRNVTFDTGEGQGGKTLLNRNGVLIFPHHSGGIDFRTLDFDPTFLPPSRTP